MTESTEMTEMTESTFSNTESPISYDLSDIPFSILAAEISRRKQPVGTIQIQDCEFCGQPFSAADSEVHRRVCVKKPPRAIRGLFRPCEFCGAEFNARAMRKHTPRCDKSPLNIKRAAVRAAAAAAQAAEEAAARKRAAKRL